MALDYQTALSEYGAIATFAQSNPEVNGILQQAIAGEWDAARFERAIWGTNWYKGLNDQQRQIEVQQATDPGGYTRSLQIEAQKIQNIAEAEGVRGDYQALAQRSLWFQWDDQTIKRVLGQEATVAKDQYGGAGGNVGDYENQIRSAYESYGLSMGDSFYENAARQVVAGTNTIGGLQNEAIAQASKFYPQYAQDFLEGRSLSDIAKPLIQQMATTLELDPSSINVNDPTIQRALQGDGKQPTTMYQFQQQLKQDPRWAKTDNAKNAAYDMLHQIGQDWGFSK